MESESFFGLLAICIAGGLSVAVFLVPVLTLLRQEAEEDVKWLQRFQRSLERDDRAHDEAMRKIKEP